MSQIREHGLLLYLKPDILSAFQKYQAARDLGRSYAGLQLLLKGLYDEGFLAPEKYEQLRAPYSSTLVHPEPPSPEQKEKQVQRNQLEAQFQGVLSIGLGKLSEKARKHWIQKARENPEVPHAKQILKLDSEKGEE